ncbi:MAG TPA: response regulator transcription factor, partial [Planctomycetaceae bacterium]|nr:response regulator transcription factor [Planctomycetaceae bacterium]
VVGLAGSIQEAEQAIAAAPPDLLVTDLSLKDGSGIELIKYVKDRFPRIRILVLSAHEEHLYAERALRAGASGYVHKQESEEKLLEAVRAVQAGRRYVNEETLQRLLDQVIAGSDANPDDPVSRLTDRELEIYRSLGQGETPSDLARRLHLSPHTVDSHRENIRHKLGLKNGRELLQHAMRWILSQEH